MSNLIDKLQNVSSLSLKEKSKRKEVKANGKAIS